MNQVLAIDPGPNMSAWVIFDGRVLYKSYEENEDILRMIAAQFAEMPAILPRHLAIETIVNYGMPVGESTFTTMFWIGRFVQAWDCEFSLIKRPDIKLHLCNSARAKDANVRQALINRFGENRQAAVGTKKSPGPLYGVKNHLWSALAVAVTWADTIEEALGVNREDA